MPINKRAKGKKGSKKKPFKGSGEITITRAQRKSVLNTLANLQKEAKDVALKIEGVQKTLCDVDFCSGLE